MDSDDEKVRRLLDSAAALEVERRKIEVFQRELPLTLQLVTQGMWILSLVVGLEGSWC